MRWHFFFLAVCAIATTDADQTSATPNHSTDHVPSAHVPSQAATHANPTSAAHVKTDHLIPTHISTQAATHANPTSASPVKTVHLIPTHILTQAATHANPTTAAHVKTDHLIPTHISSQGSPTVVSKIIPKAHADTHANPTSAAHGSTDNLIPTHVQSQLMGSLSKPTIYHNLHGNTTHITCFSKSGPLPIRYQFFLNDYMEQEKIVDKPEPASFTIPMTPGTQVLLKCTAISATGEKSSSKVSLVAIQPDDSPADDAETDHGRDGPDHLIPLQHILTSVTPDVLEKNKLVLMICGPLILVYFVLFIVFSYLRGQKEQKKGKLHFDERTDLLSSSDLDFYQNLDFTCP
ncbi:uncharacterized protein LOC130297567 isoform X2 [Hyla sarda]|uniref:uncharacterized protein LOC130297567 isoform X2 n=1 Tax=Hyla sarda TaxID=327740 RepID=UPI0024C37970|nr:uncharacterized protein LOC130297567 isoform X2 [Hyla sarda]XP_056406141.1 uncharacterized protein LOC130297567 isoform X2 [Hyla sarda]XP_056406143.1 uncharacterized protein LOC130297567 isoform X2 [Hyla sarda]XP_056406144.1 uncharacterized protein LOC130297567 isoform X2 [Hyla sarda]XP_056406145.1 uncharacterized protein LOC130297567 isoform X2 [Hyla sarda]